MSANVAHSGAERLPPWQGLPESSLWRRFGQRLAGLSDQAFAGSRAALELVPSAPPGLRELRSRLVEQGVLEPDAEAYRFAETHLFSSPSTAAAVITGSGELTTRMLKNRVVLAHAGAGPAAEHASGRFGSSMLSTGAFEMRLKRRAARSRRRSAHMPDRPIERRLAAILSADVVG